MYNTFYLNLLQVSVERPLSELCIIPRNFLNILLCEELKKKVFFPWRKTWLISILLCSEVFEIHKSLAANNVSLEFLYSVQMWNLRNLIWSSRLMFRTISFQSYNCSQLCTFCLAIPAGRGWNACPCKFVMLLFFVTGNAVFGNHVTASEVELHFVQLQSWLTDDKQGVFFVLLSDLKMYYEMMLKWKELLMIFLKFNT